MDFHMFFESLSNEINFFYVLFSLFGMYIIFIITRKLLASGDYMHRVYAVFSSFVLPSFHFYVFHFDKIPILNIDVSNNISMYYTSFYLGYISIIPFIIAGRLSS